MPETPGSPWESDAIIGDDDPPASSAEQGAEQGAEHFGQGGRYSQGGFRPRPAPIPWKKIFLGLLALFVIGNLASVGCALFIIRDAPQPTGNTIAFLSAVADDDISRARELVADGCDADALILATAGFERFNGYSVSVSTADNGDQIVAGTVGVDGAKVPIAFNMRDDLVCSVAD